MSDHRIARMNNIPQLGVQAIEHVGSSNKSINHSYIDTYQLNNQNTKSEQPLKKQINNYSDKSNLI